MLRIVILSIPGNTLMCAKNYAQERLAASNQTLELYAKNQFVEALTAGEEAFQMSFNQRLLNRFSH